MPPESPSAFVSPLAGWGNDDLLFTNKARELALAEDPESFRVLDWEELREAFFRHEHRAKVGKQRSRRTGLTAALLTGVGAFMLALAPLLPEVAARWVTGVSLAATVLGIVLGFWHWLLSGSTRRWMAERTRAERLRHLYFQSVLGHLDLAARARSDDAALADWTALRSRLLAAFYEDGTLTYRSEHFDTDHTLEHLWIRPEWQTFTVVPESDDLKALLRRLYQQRIQVQRDYVGASLKEPLHSPSDRSRILHRAGDLLTVAVAGCAIWAGWQTLSGADPIRPLALAAALGAIGLLARGLGQGLQTQSDADRLAWYGAAVEEAQRRFNSENTAGQIAALRDVERHAYQEMRQFLATHRRERFIR